MLFKAVQDLSKSYTGQKAYRLLRKISSINRLIEAIDAGDHALLGLLDLSAAFDTVDHDVLVERLAPRQQKFRAMNGAHLASPIRGELGYAQRPHLGSQIHCPIGNQIWGPLGKEDVCPNGWQIFGQQFGQL